MSYAERIVAAILLIVVDAIFFIVPLASLLCAYIIIARPEWFREWVRQLYGEKPC